MAAFTKIRFVLAVPNLQTSADFYRKVLGFTVRKVGDPGGLFRVTRRDRPRKVVPSE
jgi:catechol 2,3-dioxygenase-like lactoylglutathione lyase family enzyme